MPMQAISSMSSVKAFVNPVKRIQSNTQIQDNRLWITQMIILRALEPPGLRHEDLQLLQPLGQLYTRQLYWSY